MNMVISVIVFLAVIAFFVFITINKEDDKQVNMQTQQQDGIKITTIQEGNGEIAQSGNTVSMNYTGKLVDGTVFDSNVDPKFGHVEPFVFTIGAEEVIKGWDVGITGMKVGEKRTLEISPELAYGDNGIGPIPPKATLVFDVELLQIIK